MKGLPGIVRIGKVPVEGLAAKRKFKTTTDRIRNEIK